MSTTKTIKVDSIDRSGRCRKQMGDLQTLCDSIEQVGLLHPVVVTKDHSLVAGARRLAAYDRLGRVEIMAHVVSDLTDAMEILIAERDENTCRLDFSPKEAVAMGRALEELEQPKAKQRKVQGGKAGGKASGKLPEASKGDTRDKVGPAVGMSGRTYSEAKHVVRAAEDDPETFGAIADEMERTGKIHPAYDKVIEIKRGGTRVEAKSESPSKRKPVGVILASEAINCLKRIPINDPLRKQAYQIVGDFVRHNK